MQIQKTKILEIKEGGRLAKIEGVYGEIYDDVLLIYPYGFTSNVGSGESSLALLFYGTGSSTNCFAIPYDVLSQPSLEENEVTVGNGRDSNKILFKKDGTIEITSPTSNFSGDVNTSTVFKVSGTQVISARGAAVPDAVGGATVDTEARAAINALLARLRTHGLIGT